MGPADQCRWERGYRLGNGAGERSEGRPQASCGRASATEVMAKKKGLAGAVRRLATPVEELDREQLRDFCTMLGITPTTDIQVRARVRLGGEVRSVRVVPRAGAPALEVTVNDGLGAVTAVFLGRGSIAGITPGRKMTIEGVVGKQGNRYLVFNPIYTLLP